MLFPKKTNQALSEIVSLVPARRMIKTTTISLSVSKFFSCRSVYPPLYFCLTPSVLLSHFLSPQRNIETATSSPKSFFDPPCFLSRLRSHPFTPNSGVPEIPYGCEKCLFMCTCSPRKSTQYLVFPLGIITLKSSPHEQPYEKGISAKCKVFQIL